MKKKTLNFKEFNENIEEFKSSNMTENEFNNIINKWRNKAIVNDEILLSKAKEDNFKGDLKPVKSKKTGKTVLIYRPSINMRSMMNTRNVA